MGRGKERGGHRVAAVHADKTASFQPEHRSKVRPPPNCAFWAEAQVLGSLIDLLSKKARLCACARA